MRVTTTGYQTEQLNSILDIQAQLSEAQGQLATGKRVNKVSDDAIASGQIIRIKQEISVNQRFAQNGTEALRHIEFEEGVLSQYSNLLVRAKELIVQGANIGALSNEARNNIAIELRGLSESIMGVANSQSAQGSYIFSGMSSNVRSFSQDSAGRVTYNGDEGQRRIQVGPNISVPTNDHGARVFQEIPGASGAHTTRPDSDNTGGAQISFARVTDLAAWQTAVANNQNFTLTFNPNNPAVNFDVVDDANPGVPLTPALDDAVYTSGEEITVAGLSFTISGTPQPGDVFTISQPGQQDVFEIIANAVTSLEQITDNDTASFNMNVALEAINNTIDHNSNVRAETGTRMNTIETQENLMLDLELAGQKTVSELEDIDFAEVVSNIAQLSLNLEAIQQSFVRTQQLTLFSFI